MIRRGWWGGEAGACTESLGSETGDVGGGDDAELIIGQLAAADSAGSPEAGAESGLAAAAASPSPEKRRRLPPALPPLCMRAERRGGRLILTEVRGAELARRDVFRAERAGGRLRLRFADDDGAAPHRRGEPGAAAAASGSDGAGAGVGGAAAQHAGGRGGGGELCQVAAGAGAPGRVEATPVMMGI
ncbi:hypothetical protein BS78_05G226200 [Paspalum vaginatum]|nr:hypothetical protein BS78_05G226200 [Paspalum vaginatum]